MIVISDDQLGNLGLRHMITLDKEVESLFYTYFNLKEKKKESAIFLKFPEK